MVGALAESAMMATRMPSPIGHMLAGLAVGWLAEPATGDCARVPPRDHSRPSARDQRRGARVASIRSAFTPVVLWCAFVAAVPDADLLIPQIRHRASTHSLAATALILIIAGVVTGKVTRRVAWSIAACIAAAHASHPLLDWMGMDPNPPSGVQVLWPFDSTFYISNWDLFPPTERRLAHPNLLHTNFRAAVTEVLLVGPVASAAFVLRRIRRNRDLTSAPDVPLQPSGAAEDRAGTSGRPAPRAGQ